MINTYGYCVLKKEKIGRAKSEKSIPLHIVEIRHYMKAGVHIFNNAADAKAFINSEKINLEKFYPLAYDPDFKFSEGIVNAALFARYPFSKLENRELYFNI